MRKAILIGSSEVLPELPGVEKDIERYYDFLISNNGGAWEGNEILVSLNEGISEISRKLDGFTNVDFAFVLIAGHGEFRIYNNDPNDSRSGTYYYITEADQIIVKKLFPRVLRSVIIVDVCREYVHIKDIKKSLRDSFFSSKESARLLSREHYRALYDKQIMTCSEARMVLYSCRPDQEAGDDGDGGVFSKALLTSYKDDGLGRTLSIKDAFDYTKTYVSENHYPQVPVMLGGRGRMFFPFAIS
jgi:hypothetical protein